MDDTRLQVLRGAYDSIARRGMAKTTVEDVAAASGVSRATIYRLFPGGKEELLRDTVGWEMDRFFLDLGESSSVTPPTSPSSWSGRCRWPAGSSVSTRCCRRCSRPSPTG